MMTEELRQSIEQLYTAFARYPLKAHIVGCPHCDLKEADTGLHSKALRELSWDDLSVFPFKAMSTFGDVDDFKHFLPRILELLVIDLEGAHYDADVILGKLEYGGLSSWPNQELSAVEVYINEFLKLPV